MVLARVIQDRDEASQRAAAFLEQLAEARTVGLPDAAVLANFRHEQELGELSAAAKRLVDQINAKLDNARQQEGEGERAVARAIGALLASEGATQAGLFLERWASLIDEAAALLALRTTCERLRTSIPYEFSKLFSLKQIELASNDPRFVDEFQTARASFADLAQRLATDAEAT
jgi:hypothetical protein